MRITSFLFNFIIILLLSYCTGKSDLVYNDNFHDLDDWFVEAQSADTKVVSQENEMEVISPRGVTIWFNKKLNGPVRISYEANVIDQDGPYDRVSDLNCFWMAKDPENIGNFFTRSDWRGGSFGKYYSLKLYYVGYGGHDNTRTRFRKYDGDYQAYKNQDKRPEVIREYTDPAHLIVPNQWHRIEIVVDEKNIQYIFNNEVLIDYNDPNPYSSGYFGLRTVNNHLKIRNFKIYRI